MTPQQEQQCWQRYAEQGDIESRDQLFGHYQRWAEFEAVRLYRQLSINGLELQEYQQWAFEGMLKAIEGFSLTHNVTFKSYAVHRVRGAIFSALPHISEVSAYYARHGKTLNQTAVPSAQEGALVGDSSSGEPVAELVSLVMDLSVDYLLKEPESDLTQLTGTFYSSPEINTISARIREYAQRLEEPMQSIIRLYYFAQLSFGKIAELLELSNGRVSQLHKRAIVVLKKRIGW
ncbi:MAG: RNA polymerase sigma factor for flagellar operon FliA [Phenylobacterium sp.]|jgi:RNA polymerase sigma factor for flagellar operon FliA